MNTFSILNLLVDKGGRRLSVDRRQFSYTVHVPDRRYKSDRRSEHDRRFVVDQRSEKDRRAGHIVELKFENMRRGLDRRCGTERRLQHRNIAFLFTSHGI